MKKDLNSTVGTLYQEGDHQIEGLLPEKDNFSKRLDDLKDKILELRKINSDYFTSQKQATDLAEEFIKDFREEKAELGKIVSWLGDVISPEELVAIVGDSISNKDLGSLALKVQSRLLHNYKEPESFNNQHITNLVEVLNTYDNYIESFESIEVSDDLNCLDRNKYLISHDLQNLLLNGYKLNRNREINKKETGIYIVVFKMIKWKGEDVLIHNYIKYPDIFHDTLYSYIVRESSSLVITNDKSVGMDYLFVMKPFFEREKLLSEISTISDMFKHKSLYRNSRGIYPRNIVDLCKMLLQGCPIFLSKNDTCELIKLVSQRRIYDAFVQLIELYDFYKNEQEGLAILQDKLRKPNLEKYNLLGRLIFVTDDLDSLIKELQVSFGGQVNQGPQSWRGQSNSLSHTINSIDTDYRRSLNRHNQYHVNQSNIPRNSLIGRSKFSYQNIHLNIGNVRWNSTKAYRKPNVQNNQGVFRDIANYVKDSPVNADTQLKIESTLHDHSYIHLEEKAVVKGKPVINYSLINREFSNLLLEENPKLVDYIDRARAIKFDEEPVIEKDIINYYFSFVVNELTDDYIISVIYGRLFKLISKYFVDENTNKILNVFLDIGSDLVTNLFYVLYTKSKKELKDDSYKLSDWKRDNEYLVSKFDGTMKSNIGGKIINILKSLDLIQFKLVTLGWEEKNYVIIPTKRVLAVIDKNNTLKPLPHRLPMIVKPKNYVRTNGTKEVLGGYLLNGEKYTDPLMIPKWDIKKPSIIKDKNLVYDLVNNINSVGFKINKEVLEFINIYGDRYNLIISSNYEHPLSSKKKLTKLEYVELSSFMSQKDLQENILGVAEIFSHVHEFFLPTRLDFRGRLYCMSEFLTYQSTELAKSLILFSNSEKLYKHDRVAIDFLKAYGANCFGNKLDKSSWKARSKWVDDNIDKIISFRDGELIERAENKLLFISFCFEYNRLLDCFNNGKDYIETCLPIQLDATCNGYQHLALLSLDYDLAKEVNLTKSTPEDAPKDFYHLVGVKLVNYFRDQLNNNKNLTEDEKEIYTRFSNLTVARKMIKKSIMTKVYNASLHTMIEYLKENFEVLDTSDKTNIKCYYKEDPSIILMEKDFPILARVLVVVLIEDRSRLMKLLKYLYEVVSITNSLNLPVHWGTPETGVDIEQNYIGSEEKRLKVFSYTRKTFTIRVPKPNKLNKRKQSSSFLPNFIHSLDAASLALLVNYYFTDSSFTTKNIYTIHDCFAVTANNVKTLQLTLSSVYQKIYTQKSYLREFHNNTIRNILYSIKKGDAYYEGDTLVIKIKNKILPFPSVDEVLGPEANKDDLIKSSCYLTN